MIQFGNDKIKDIYVGSDKIKEVYYGSELVWGEIESIQGGYWVHKDTGVKTYFDTDADFITGGIMGSPSWKLDCSEVQIPSGVTGLGGSCFLSSSLTSITLPEGVTSIGEWCFLSCYSLTSINIPEGVTSIGDYCFGECTSLTSINIPESVISIGMFCFYMCTSLTLATILPATPPTLGELAFDNVHTSFNIQVRSPYVNDYKTATNWINYASKITAIGTGYWVHKGSSVKTYFEADAGFITNGIMHRPSWAPDCSEVLIPSGVTGIGGLCFSECLSLTSVIIPEGVTSLGFSCFDNCYALTSINIPEGVVSLGSDCFAYCSALTSITLPESVASIGGYCFEGCTSLTLATVLPEIPPTLGDSAFDDVHTSFNIQVRSPYVNDYKTATNWINYASKITAI